MTVAQAVEMVREAFGLMLLVSLPVLGAAVVIGLIVSVLQAATQVQEQTLSFVPKIVGMAIVAIIFLPWITVQIMSFAERMFSGQ